MDQNPILERYLAGRKGPGMRGLLKIPIVALAGLLWPEEARAQSPEQQALATCVSTGVSVPGCCVKMICPAAQPCLLHWDQAAVGTCLQSNCNMSALSACAELGATMNFGQPPAPPPPPPPVVTPPALTPREKLTQALQQYCIPKAGLDERQTGYNCTVYRASYQNNTCYCGSSEYMYYDAAERICKVKCPAGQVPELAESGVCEAGYYQLSIKDF